MQDDQLVGFGFIGAASLLAGIVFVPILGLPPGESIILAVVSGAIHVGYYTGLMRAYQLGAFNQMYPVARGTSPLLVTVGGAVFAGEHPGGVALAGIAVLAAGLFVLAATGGHVQRADAPALVAAVLTGVTIATYTIVDGLGVRHAADPFSYMALSFLCQGLPLVVAVAIARRPSQWVAGSAAARGLLAGSLAVVAYGAVMWCQTKAPLAEVAALRETGVISGAVIGALFFKEGFGVRRVAAAAVVAAGILLIAL